MIMGIESKPLHNPVTQLCDTGFKVLFRDLGYNLPMKMHPLSPAWSPHQWQQQPTGQQPTYDDPRELAAVCKKLAQLPPLVTVAEIETLKSQLAEATEGKRFILQGGDCAESFRECNDEIIANKLKILLQMSLVLVQDLKMPITRIGRMAGQYAKPRSTRHETRNGISLPSYRGDLINAIEFSEQARTPDPTRMLQGYGLASLTLNYIRALMESGFADLHKPEQWHLSFLQSRNHPKLKKYQNKVETLLDSIALLESISGKSNLDLQTVEFFTCHEALLLHYETALTRNIGSHWYNLSTHFPWIGMRTALPESGHVEYIKGISNPVAIKVGAELLPADLERLLRTLNPDNEPGKISLIHRFGVDHIRTKLPPLIQKVKAMGYAPLWICDPMHGNTHRTRQGLKTRHFADITKELELAFQLHHYAHSHLGGVHLEMTADAVTECTGGGGNLQEIDLHKNYRSAVDPRLNAEQAIEMALLIGEMVQQNSAEGDLGHCNSARI